MTYVDLVVDSFRRTPHGAGHSERTRQELLAALAEANLLDGLSGLQIRELDEDEVLLVGPDGGEVRTWQQDYPYQHRMRREEYVGLKRDLQVELLKMQSWVKDTGQRVVVLFEGRDAAGKGGTMQRFIEHLNPRGARVVALERPTATEATQWYFQRYFQPTAVGRGDRAVRPVLIQPGGRRAGDGFLHPGRAPGVPAAGPRPGEGVGGRCPRANCFAERLVLTARTELTDRMLIFSERQLRNALARYAAHYNAQRPHRALQLRPPRSQAPVSRPSLRPVPGPAYGRIQRRPVLGGLINQYEAAA